MKHQIEITHIYVAAGHNFVGNPAKDAEMYPAKDLEAAEVVQHAGLRGDRFFKYDPEFDAHITFFQQEVHDELVATFDLPHLKADRYRRNVCVKGYDIHSLVGKEFTVNGVRFFGTEIAEPCKWMEVSVHSGAMKFLVHRAGIRAQVLSTGILRKGLTELVLEEKQRELVL